MTDNGTDFGGYPDLDSLVKGYRSSGDEAKRQKQRADQAESQLQQVRMLEQQRQPVPQRDQYGRFVSDPSTRLSEYGVPVDALDQHMDQRIQSAIQSAFSPIAQGIHAREKLMSEYGDYNQYEGDVAKYMSQDPELAARYQKMFSSDPAGAMEYAFLKFGKSRQNGNGNPAPPQPQKIEAQVPSNRMGSGTSQVSGQDEVLAKAWERYQKTGDPTSFARARLSQAISDDFLAR